jgi:signal transduction histidine kinase/CheY-like chemotaxis protein
MTIFFVLLLTQSTWADTFQISQDNINHNLSEYTDYFNDPSEAYSYLQLRQSSFSNVFTPIHNDYIRHGILQQPTWLRIRLTNNTGNIQNLHLILDSPHIERADLYMDQTYNGFMKTTTGSSIAYNDRPFPIGNYVLPITIHPGFHELFLFVKTVEPANLKLQIRNETASLQKLSQSLLFHISTISILFVMSIVALISLFKFRTMLSFRALGICIGFVLSISSWSGLISTWFPTCTFIEIRAENVGALMILASFARLLADSQNERHIHWVKSALRWLSYVLFFLTAAAIFLQNILTIQTIVSIIALLLIGLFWVLNKPQKNTEKLMLLAFFGLATYFSTTALIMSGIIFLGEPTFFILRCSAFIAVAASLWPVWIISTHRHDRVAVEGMNIPNMHWPLLRKINHDIRGPINGVLGMAELLQDTTLSAHQQEYINTVQAAGHSLLREADQLQNLIRIGLNRIPDSEGEFDLYDLVEDTLSPFSRIAHNKGIELVLDITPEIPTHYRGNSHIIAQILSILIENAIQYTEHGEIIIQIKPWQQNRIRFSITDTGPGISKQARSQLFSFPSPDTNKRSANVHIGLPISKYLVGILGGQLTLNSELRKGTTVWLDIPLIESKPSNSNAEQPNLPLDKLRLMVVDDNLTCRKVIEHLAQSWRMSVLSMSNGQSALANLHNEFHKGKPIDVLIVDQNMPSMSGVELVQRIRQDSSLNQDIVIVMMSGADEVASQVNEQGTGVKYALSKPVSARALRDTLNVAHAEIIQNKEARNVKKSHFF